MKKAKIPFKEFDVSGLINQGKPNAAGNFEWMARMSFQTIFNSAQTNPVWNLGGGPTGFSNIALPYPLMRLKKICSVMTYYPVSLPPSAAPAHRIDISLARIPIDELAGYKLPAGVPAVSVSPVPANVINPRNTLTFHFPGSGVAGTSDAVRNTIDTLPYKFDQNGFIIDIALDFQFTSTVNDAIVWTGDFLFEVQGDLATL